MSQCEFNTQKGQPCKGKPIPDCLFEGKRACAKHHGGGCQVPGCSRFGTQSPDNCIEGYICKDCNRAIAYFKSAPQATPEATPQATPQARPPEPPPKPKRKTKAKPPAPRQDWEILGLKSAFATKREIRKAYLKKAKEWHPDRSAHADATGEFQDIYAAYCRMTQSK